MTVIEEISDRQLHHLEIEHIGERIRAREEAWARYEAALAKYEARREEIAAERAKIEKRRDELAKQREFAMKMVMISPFAGPVVLVLALILNAIIDALVGAV